MAEATTHSGHLLFVSNHIINSLKIQVTSTVHARTQTHRIQFVARGARRPDACCRPHLDAPTCTPKSGTTAPRLVANRHMPAAMQTDLGVSTCCWDAYKAHNGSAETTEALWELVRDGEKLKHEWSARFPRLYPRGTPPPALMCLLPITATDPNDSDFKVRIAMVEHLAKTTTYAKNLIVKHLDVPTLRGTAKARTGKRWGRDPLVQMLIRTGIITIVPKKWNKTFIRRPAPCRDPAVPGPLMTTTARYTVFALQEVMEIIFGHLPSHDLVLTIPFVCKQWRTTAANYPCPLISVDTSDERLLSLHLVARCLPKTFGLSIASEYARTLPSELSAIARFKGLKRLTLFACAFDKCHYKHIMDINLHSLELFGVRLPGPKIMAQCDNSQLSRLSLGMCDTYARSDQDTSTQVAELVRSARGLRVLELREVSVNYADLEAMLSACPRLERLHLWKGHPDGANSERLACIAALGASLQFVVFTRHQLFNHSDGKFRTTCDIKAFARTAFELFEKRPGFRRLSIRMAEPDLKTMLAASYDRWTLPPGCVKPSLNLLASPITMERRVIALK